MLSQIVSFLILLYFFLGGKTLLRLSVRRISRTASVYRTFLVNGMPSLFRQGLASVSSVLLNHVAASQGDAAVAAMSIVGKVFMMVFCVLIGFGQGYQPVAGYNYGAGEYGRVRQSFRFLLVTGTVGMSALGAGLFALAPYIMGQFVSDDAQVMEIGTQALRMQCLAMPLMTLGVACNMTFQSVGRPVQATVLSSCRQGIFFLPFLWLLPRYWGILGMEAAQPAADAATFLTCLPVILWFFHHMDR
jgi:Na+-driven multidrug efflux pump